jgi:pimeloyl-ACP methyl ester carboxylesterase
MTILFGRSDGVVPFSLSELWQESFPHAEIIILEGAGHMLAYETDEISVSIKKMLADQGAHK